MKDSVITNPGDFIDRDGYVLDPSPWVVRSLLSSQLVIDGNIRVLLSSEVLSSLEREFTVIAQLVDLEQSGDIKVREIGDVPAVDTDVLITDKVVGSYISTGGDGIFIGNDEMDTSTFLAQASDLWDQGDSVVFSSPSETRVFDVVVSMMSRDVHQDFWELNYITEKQILETNPMLDELFTDQSHIYMSLVVSGALHEEPRERVRDTAQSLWSIDNQHFDSIVDELVHNEIVRVDDGVLLFSDHDDPVDFENISERLVKM